MRRVLGTESPGSWGILGLVGALTVLICLPPDQEGDQILEMPHGTYLGRMHLLL